MICRLERALFKTCAVMVGGTIVLASQMPAHAGHQGGGFREFRLQNSGLDRHAARRMFNADRRIERVVESHGVPVSAEVQQVAPTMSRADIIRAERRSARFNAFDGRRQSFQSNDNGAFVRLNSGINLDLTSNNANIVLGNNLFSDSVSNVVINVGGETKTVAAGSRVTAAEYVAVKQVLNGQSQSVSIDRAGAASGGIIDLGSLTQDNDVMRASNLVVAGNVTTTGDFGRHSDFRLTGDLINYGTINASSSDRNVRSGTIHADDIANHAGALINSTVDLKLDAAGDLSNDGTIVSSGALTLAAGGTVANTGAIRATDSVNVQSSEVKNSGLIRSTSGNVNLSAPGTSALTVNNSGGTIAALQGAINVRDTAYSGEAGSTVTGGDLFSRELNLNSGLGLVEVSVNQLTGVISGTGSAAHVSANTDVLTIGEVCLSGDPTFYNHGDINITADLVVSQDLVIVAEGNISSNNDLKIQAGDLFNGRNITMIAGADFEAKIQGKDLPTLPPPGSGFASGVILSGKASKTGGGIQLGSNVQVLAQSQDTVGPDSGGNITLAAFCGKDALAGKVMFTGTTLNTGGLPGGENGDVTIIAGSKAGGTVVDVGVIDTTAGGDGTSGGKVIISTSSPISVIKGVPIEYDGFGVLVAGALGASTKLNRNADIHVGNQSSGTEIKASNDVIFAAGGKIVMEGQIQSLLSNVQLQSTGTINGDTFSLVKASAVDLEAGGNIGTDVIKFRVDAPLITLNSMKTSKGANSFLEVLATPDVNVQAQNAKGRIVIDGSSSNVGLFSNSSKVIDLTAQQLGAAAFNPKGADAITLTTLDPTFDLSDITISGVKTLTLNSARDVGSSGTPNNIGKVKNMFVNAAQDSYLILADKKTVLNITAGRDINLVANAAVIGSATATTGKLFVDSHGSVSVLGDVTAGTDVTIATSINAKTSSKISIAANTKIHGETIFISVGAVTSTPAPDVANLKFESSAGGATLLSGAGAKAKAPLNSGTATGVNKLIWVNNGLKTGNISFGGGVVMTAD